jgi:hypothetical protein
MSDADVFVSADTESRRVSLASRSRGRAGVEPQVHETFGGREIAGELEASRSWSTQRLQLSCERVR